MTEDARRPQLVNVHGLDWTGTDDDGGRWKRVGQAAGGTRLGCTLEEIQPGGCPAEYHYHVANEEAMYVLDGTGTLRTPAGETEIGSGDYVSFPTGESGAHAVENTSEHPLRCLFVSTMDEPDVVVYPDSGKLHVVAGAVFGGPRGEFTIDASQFDGDATDPTDVTDADDGE